MLGRARRYCSWRRTGKLTVVAMLVLWAAATVFGFIGDTRFIGHTSMLALVLTAMAWWRSDEPTEGE